MIKNLITGIGGFVASHLADLLIEKGEEVWGTYRWNEDLSKIQHIKDKINLLPADLLDLKSMINVIAKARPDYVFHLAAQSYVPDSFAYPNTTIQTNTIGTLNLLEAIRFLQEITDGIVENECKNATQISYLRAKGIFLDPIIHICSSSEVYGQVEQDDIPIKETQAFNPANPYAVGKIGADMLGLLYFKNHGMKIIRTRMFTHTGPRRSMMSAECNFARQIAMIEKEYRTITNYNSILKHGNLNSVRTWADVRDAVKAYWLLVRKCKAGEVYNIGGNTQKSIGEMLDYLISLSKVKIKKIQDPDLMRPSDVIMQVPDTSKFRKETGWKPMYTFEQTMQDLLDWWRAHV